MGAAAGQSLSGAFRLIESRLVTSAYDEGDMQKSDLKTVWVHCYKGRDTLLRSYDFGVAVPLTGELKLPTREHLESQAKTNLTNERLAFPPYDGIKFKIDYPA